MSAADGVRPMRLARTWILCGAMFAAAVVLFLAIERFGRTLSAPESTTAVGTSTATPQPMVHVLIALAAVIATGQILARLFRWIGQPPVIGEVVAGILLGPSLLGWIAPAAAQFVLPAEVAPYLGVIAQLGVILYMFLVGLELNPAMLRGRAATAAFIAHSSMVMPFLLGTGLAIFLYPRLSSADVRFSSFALFLGVALSITAFPVLARILTDRRMHTTPLGVMALGCAALGDVTAWCLLAFVVGIARAEVGGAFAVLGFAALFGGLMLLVVRPLLARWLPRDDGTPLAPGIAAAVFVGLLLAALTAEAIGIHALFGAFLLGAVIPHDSAVARSFGRTLEEVVTILLLPAFFAFTGMRTQIGLVSGAENWLLCGLILLVAVIGKFGGTFTAARLTGLPTREAAGLGALMNTRGLVELIVLNVGLDMGVISPTLFAMMVVMALVTTLTTGPMLSLLRLDSGGGR
jgi:Kef-type K+ transport system membrane component KefB